MACQSHGFDVLSLSMSDDSLAARLLLMTGACSSPETPVTRYVRMDDGSVRRSDRVDPAFTWSTGSQLSKVVAMVAPILTARRMELHVEGRESEDLGGLQASVELTDRLGRDMTPEEFVAAAEEGLVDQSPVDAIRSSREE